METRINKRYLALTEAAKAAGFETWSAVETAVIHNEAQIVKVEQQIAPRPAG